MTTATYSIGEWVECVACRISYKCEFDWLRWWWVDGKGPYCERCMKRGVTVTTVSAVDNPGG